MKASTDINPKKHLFLEGSATQSIGRERLHFQLSSTMVLGSILRPVARLKNLLGCSLLRSRRAIRTDLCARSPFSSAFITTDFCYIAADFPCTGRLEGSACA
jgi:hypothetical protein